MKKATRQDARPLVEGEDFYWDGAAMVFTKAYHLARGYCCESGCRHCPYREPASEHKQIEVTQMKESTRNRRAM